MIKAKLVGTNNRGEILIYSDKLGYFAIVDTDTAYSLERGLPFVDSSIQLLQETGVEWELCPFEENSYFHLDDKNIIHFTQTTAKLIRAA